MDVDQVTDVREDKNIKPGSEKSGCIPEHQKPGQTQANVSISEGMNQSTTIPEEKADVAWSFEERAKLVEAIYFDSGRNDYRIMTKMIQSADKRQNDVANYVRYLRKLETGVPFKEFLDKTPIDAWLELSERLPGQDDKSAEVCIPQTMTVAALEPGLSQTDPTSGGDGPCFANVYNFLAAVLKGNDPPELPPVDSKVVLELLEGLINKLANSHTLLQKEYMHEAFESLCEQTEQIEDNTCQKGKRMSSSNKSSSSKKETQESTSQTQAKRRKTISNPEPLSSHSAKPSFPSMNPFKIPIYILDFKQKGPKVYDVGVSWKTTYKVDGF